MTSSYLARVFTYRVKLNVKELIPVAIERSIYGMECWGFLFGLDFSIDTMCHLRSLLLYHIIV